MYGFLFREIAAFVLLCLVLVVGATYLSEPTWPGEAVTDNPPIFVEPPEPLREGDEGVVTLPLVGICAMPLRLFTDSDDHRLLTGHLAQRYIDSAEVDVLVGTDTVLYTQRDESVVVLFAKQGCVVGMYLVPRAIHRAVMERAFGASLYVPAGGEAAQKGDLEQFYTHSQAPKGDLALAPVPRDKPDLRKPCAFPFEILTELEGWRIHTGDKAVKYADTAFNTHPPIDAVAWFVYGKKTAVIMSYNGCVIGRIAMETKKHKAFVEMALGRIA